MDFGTVWLLRFITISLELFTLEGLTKEDPIGSFEATSEKARNMNREHLLHSVTTNFRPGAQFWSLRSPCKDTQGRKQPGSEHKVVQLRSLVNRVCGFLQKSISGWECQCDVDSLSYSNIGCISSASLGNVGVA